MSGINVREGEDRTVQVELWGEFDLHDLQNLRDALGDAASSGQAAVDLSGVTFLDLETTRELAAHSQLHAGQLVLRSPSAAVRASIAVCGLESWFDFSPGPMDGVAVTGKT